jgi:hypothetical protein
MQTQVKVCGPDELKLLQQVFDAVWLELQNRQSVRSGDEALRQLLSRRVMALAHRHAASSDDLRQEVLKSFETAL